QTETEATGAPQKHHYTLNQQVGSITRNPASLFNSLVHSQEWLEGFHFIQELDKILPGRIWYFIPGLIF
ncbi:hypothetical protein LPI93_26155, partial [Klebsiella pneumoniae]|nr:hypothetical protein [Klebsiella pneumoniae]